MLSLYGVEEERRLDLVGGGRLRSVGGWRGLKELRDGGEKVRTDERILGGIGICRTGIEGVGGRMGEEIPSPAEGDKLEASTGGSIWPFWCGL